MLAAVKVRLCRKSRLYLAQDLLEEGDMADGKRGNEFTILMMCLIGAFVAFMIAGAVGN